MQVLKRCFDWVSRYFSWTLIILSVIYGLVVTWNHERNVALQKQEAIIIQQNYLLEKMDERLQQYSIAEEIAADKQAAADAGLEYIPKFYPVPSAK